MTLSLHSASISQILEPSLQCLIIFGQILEIPVIVSCESHFERDLSNVWKIDLDPILGIFFLSDMYIVMEIGSHVKMHKVGDIILI